MGSLCFLLNRLSVFVFSVLVCGGDDYFNFIWADVCWLVFLVGGLLFLGVNWFWLL